MREEWWELRNAGLTPFHVAALVHSAGMALLGKVSIRYDVSFVVLRGGRLLEPCLGAYGYKPINIEAKRDRRCSLPEVPVGARTLLVCDTLADTGGTLAGCLEEIRLRVPDAVAHACCLFITERAIERLRPVCGVIHSLEVFGRGPVTPAVPSDIPYDFGDVADAISIAAPIRTT